jgi:tol-pal system protein YbgF
MIATRVRPPATLMVLPLSLAACATGYPLERGQRLEERLDQIETRGGTGPSESERVASQRQDARIAALEKQAAQAPQSSSGPSARVSEQIAALQRTVDDQRKQIEEQSRRLDEVWAKAHPSGPATTNNGFGGQPVNVPRTPPAAPPHLGSPKPPDSGEPSELLRFAHEQEALGNHAAASEVYSEYVKKHPSDPKSAEALFQLGEIAFAERHYQDAAVHFGRVAQDFSASERAPEALLRTADSMEAGGMRDDARTVLTSLPRRYPNSQAAKRARERLAQIGGATKP